MSEMHQEYLIQGRGAGTELWQPHSAKPLPWTEEQVREQLAVLRAMYGDGAEFRVLTRQVGDWRILDELSEPASSVTDSSAAGHADNGDQLALGHGGG